MGTKVNFDWWTKERVINGLERFIRDIAGGDEAKLPQSLNGYTQMIPESDRRRHKAGRLYPPYAAVLRHFESFTAAWWSFGYLVEVRIHNPKWKLTEEIKERLYEICNCPYPVRSKKRPKDLPGLKQYARQLGIPKHVTTKWAIHLGLSRVKEPPWSPKELAVLDEFGFQSPTHLQRTLAKYGFTRTRTGITLMRKRRMSMKAAPYYSVNSLSKLFGLDAHVVTGWCEEELLKFIYKGTERVRTETHITGDTKLVHQDSIYEFACQNPLTFNLRNVDQLWFLHIITRGEVKFGLSDPSLLTLRMECRQMETPVEHRKGTPRGPKPKQSPEASI